MSSLAVLHASQLVTIAGPSRARRGKELGELQLIPDGGFIAADRKITNVDTSSESEKLCARQTQMIGARKCCSSSGAAAWSYSTTSLPTICFWTSRPFPARLSGVVVDWAGRGNATPR